MVTPCRIAVLAATSLLLGACTTVFDLVGVAVPLSASASRTYDGSYQGYVATTTIATTAGSRPCPNEHGERVLMLGDGVLWYPYDPDTFFAASVNSDGVIQGTDAHAAIKGKITGNHLVATVTTPNCTSQMSMYYLYNHS